jgi:hypothetical protein
MTAGAAGDIYEYELGLGYELLTAVTTGRRERVNGPVLTAPSSFVGSCWTGGSSDPQHC